MGSMMFSGSKLWKVKNWAENENFLPTKWFWLSFPEINSDWAEILYEAAQQIFMFYGPISENAKKLHFFATN